MTNILELVNPTLADMQVKLSLYSILGELVHERYITIAASNQFDVILNDLPGFVRDSYGIVKLEFPDGLDGRMMYYRPAPDGNGYDFVFGLPLVDPSYGPTAVSFNTFQPSFLASERNNIVANWLSIVNLDSNAQAFTIGTYDQMGTLLAERNIDVPAFGRMDLDGGHDIAGPSVVGVHVITPKDLTAKYIAQLSRYGGDAPAGFAPSTYRFAFPLVAQYGASDPIYAPISTKFGEYNWLEVVNILDREVTAAVNFYSHDGTLIESVDLTLPPHAQQHFDAASYLAPGDTGYAAVAPGIPFSLIANSMGYMRNSANGSITAIYGSQARRDGLCAVAGSYNLFLNMENYLTVANPQTSQIQVTVSIHGPNLALDKTYSVPARGSLYLPLHDATQFKTAANTYGLVTVRANTADARIYSDLLRVRKLANGLIDFAAPIPLR